MGAEETLRVALTDDASAPAGTTADALDRLDKALEKLEGREIDVKTGGLSLAAIALERLKGQATQAGSALAAMNEGLDPGRIGAATAAAVRLSSVFDLMKNRANEASAAQARLFAQQEAWGSHLPTELQPGAAPKKIDLDAAFSKVASESGSALKAAAHDALETAVALAKAEVAGKKLTSVFELVAKRAAEAAKAEARIVSEAERAANRVPTALQPGAAPKAQTGFGQLLSVVDKLFGSKAAGGLSSGAASLVQAADKLGPAGPALLQGGKFLAMGAAAVGVAAAALVAAAAVIAYKLLEAGLKLSIASTSARESFEASVKRFVGGAKEAHEVYANAIKIAVDLSLDKEDVLKKAKELAGVGFKGAEIDVILRTRADIATSSEEKANAFQKLLEKLKSGKQFNQESLNALTEAGINSDAVLAKLAEKLGVKINKVKELLKAGKIDVQTGMQAIIAAAQGQYGGAAGNAAGAIPAKIQSIKTLFESMFDSVDLSGIKSALDSVMHVLEGPGGEKLKAAVNTLFKTISDIFGKAFSGKEGEARLQRFLTGITKIMEGAAVLIEQFGPTIINVIDGISKVLDRNGSTTGGSWLQSIALGLASIAGSLLGFDAVTPLSGLFNMLNAAEPYVTKAFALGSQIVQGLIQGMIAGGDPGAVLVGIVANAIAGAAGPKGADAHSPSRKTGQLGDWMGQGLVQRLQAWQMPATLAGQGLAAAAIPANDNMAAPSPSAHAGGGNVTIQVTINAGPGMSRDQAQELGDAAGEAAYQAWRRNMGRFVRDERRSA